MLKRAFRKRWLLYHTDGTLNYINQVEAAFWQTHFRGFGRNSWFCSITMLGPLSLLGQWSSQPSARSAERASKRRMMRKRMDSEDLESLCFWSTGWKRLFEVSFPRVRKSSCLWLSDAASFTTKFGKHNSIYIRTNECKEWSAMMLACIFQRRVSKC